MVSGSGMTKKVVVIDARHHMLGRLSSIIAKELLNGQKIVRVLVITDSWLELGVGRQRSLRFTVHMLSLQCGLTWMHPSAVPQAQ